MFNPEGLYINTDLTLNAGHSHCEMYVCEYKLEPLAMQNQSMNIFDIIISNYNTALMPITHEVVFL